MEVKLAAATASLSATSCRPFGLLLHVFDACALQLALVARFLGDAP